MTLLFLVFTLKGISTSEYSIHLFSFLSDSHDQAVASIIIFYSNNIR